MVKKNFLLLGVLTFSASLSSNTKAMENNQKTLDSYFDMNPKYTLAAKREKEEREKEEKRRKQAAQRLKSWQEWQYRVKSKSVS